MSKNKQFGICVIILYIIGLFGDSYFGIVDKSGVLSSFYNAIFMISSYTRNGVFYVPIFLSLGYMFANKEKKEIKKGKYVFITIISIALMVLEGLILKYFNLQKHDSMYIMLIPVMMSVFTLVLNANKENNKTLRNIATVIYIIHPIMIILIRGASKIVNLESIMVENSLIHYVLVVISSLIFSVIFEMIKKRRNNIR
ncbi:MAG: acyltransferase family protein [Clostridia bacterium]|nr:acyltransferase family protein [Clostridia bacterium]